MPLWSVWLVAEWITANALALVLALLLDAVFGEPHWLWKRVPHPVVLIGRLIGWLDKRWNLATKSDAWRTGTGLVALCVVLVVVGAITLGVLALAQAVHPVLALIVQVLVGTVFLAQRSLHDHVADVYRSLKAGDLPTARKALSMIVGRKTESLNEEGVTRAALESLAENHSDGVVAPAFWFLIGGAPGIALYKAINTADSMIGYRTKRHRAFGWASAKLDDAVNWLPARLSVGLIALGVLGAKLLRYPVALALPPASTVWHDAPTHASPNAGWPEATYASALGVALGGPRIYPDHTVDAPYINDAGRKALVADDIRGGLLLFQATCAATLVLVAAIVLAGI